MHALFLACAGVGLGWLALSLLGGHGSHAAGHGGHTGHLHLGHLHASTARAGGRGGAQGLGSPLVLAAALALGGVAGEAILLVSPTAVLMAALGAVGGLVLGAAVSAVILSRLIEAQTPELPPADYVGWRGPLLQSLTDSGDIAEMMASAPVGDERRCLRVRLSVPPVALARGTVVVVVSEVGGGVYGVVSEEALLKG